MAKMHQIRFRFAQTPLGKLQRSPRPPSWGLLLRGGKGGEEKAKRGQEGEGRDQVRKKERGGKGKGEGGEGKGDRDGRGRGQGWEGSLGDQGKGKG